MNTVSENFSEMKHYLLGTLNDEDALRRIEEKILLDDRFADQVSIAEDELIESYLDGELTAPETEQFLRFFLAPPQRREKFQFIKNLKEYARKADQPRQTNQTDRALSGWFLAPAFLRFAVILVLAGAVGLIVWRTVVYESDTDKGLAQLTAAYRGTRPVEARLTPDFGYAPFTVTRGQPAAPSDARALDRAERYLLDAAENPSDARAHHGLGLFYLNEKQFDKALDEFTLALENSPASAEINSDVGAAFLEKARQSESARKDGETLENLARALEHLNRALEINGQLQPALFNKALVLQKLRSTVQAREAWEKYLEVDAVSQWANEARRNLENLQQEENQLREKSQVLEDFLDAFRRRDEARAWQIASQTKEMITGVMIPQQLAEQFLEVERQGREQEAEEILSAFFYLGELENKFAGDRFFSDLSRVYAASGRRQKLLLASAHDLMARSYEFLQGSDITSAAASFGRAKSAFLEAGSVPESMIVDYQLAYCLNRQNKINESNDIIFALLARSERKNYRWIETIAAGWAASNFTLLSEQSRALEYNEKYLAAARETANSYEIQKALTQITQAYWIIGDTDRVLSNIYQILNVNSDYYLSPRQHTRNLIFTTEGLFRLKLFDASGAFAREEQLTALKTKERSFLHTARYHLALIYGKTGDYEKSFAEIEEAFRIADSTENPAIKKILTAKTRLISAHLRRESGDCASAVTDYDQTIQAYENSEFSINMYEARKGRLLCYIHSKNDEAVRAEMPELLKTFDAYRRRIDDEYNRNVFFDNEQTVYDIAVDYQYSQLKDFGQAFNYAENSRARSLLDLVSKTESQPLSIDEISRRVPARVQMLYYSVLPDKILIWHFSNGRYSIAESAVTSAELNALVQSLLSSLRKDMSAQERENASEKLYRLLIKPVGSNLEPGKPLCILADKILFRVPFASLRSTDSGRFLIEDFALVYAPSASVFIRETELAAQKASVAEEAIFSVGNPEFSRTEYKALADLPAAEKEAAAVALLYRQHKTLFGKQAVKSEIVRQLSAAEVFHFAGHYMADPDQPLRSRFLLSGADLPVGEIMKKQLPRMRLMILSACETGVEKFYKGEGMIGAARAFLAADVPLVVASHWPVDSEATAELMIKFHTYRKQGNLKTVEALRRAQIDMLKSGDSRFQSPFYWSGFLPIGGFADY